MNALLRPYPSAETISAVLALAERTLLEDGYIRLGAFVIALNSGSTCYKYGSLVHEYWDAFADLQPWELLDFYEIALLYLDKRHGPLICRDRDSCDSSQETWGYAERSCNHCDRVMEGAPPRYLMASARRSAALKDGHPDMTAKRLREVLPNTVWSRKPATKKAA